MKLELIISIVVYILLVNDSFINCSRILRSNRRKISINNRKLNTKFLSHGNNVTNFNATKKAAFKKKIFPIIFCCPRYPQVVYASTASLATVPVVVTAGTASAASPGVSSTGAATATARLVLTAQESKNKSAQQRAQRRRRRNRRRNRRNRNKSGPNGRKRRQRQRRRRRRRRNRRVFNRDATGLGNQRLVNGDDVSLFDRLRLIFQRSTFGNLFRSRAMKAQRSSTKINVNERQKNNSRRSHNKSNNTRDKVNRKS